MTHRVIGRNGEWSCRCGVYLARTRAVARVILRDHKADVWMAPVHDAIERSKQDECVIWQGALTHSGYARIGDTYIHRLVFELVHGPVDSALHIDHLCHNRACVNVRHLEPVTSTENNARGFIVRENYDPRDRCKRGHPRTPENIYWIRTKTNTRDCRPCRRIRSAASRERRRVA